MRETKYNEYGKPEYRNDMVGKSHFSKTLQRDIDTPHCHEFFYNHSGQFIGEEAYPIYLRKWRKNMNELIWLQDWYQSYCDGDWEHFYGVSIDTLDNPGWSLKICIVDTKLLGKKYELKSVEIDDLNWYRCWVENGFFRGVGGVQNLVDIIRCFRQWVEE